MIYLDAPTLGDCYAVAGWRNQVRQTLRTPGMTTEGQQEAFYQRICQSDSRDRYYAVRRGGELEPSGTTLLAFGGFAPADHVNRSGEISLIVNPELRRQGYGAKTFLLLLWEGFWHLNLHIVYGEAYWCNPDLAFWQKMVRRLDGHAVTVPDRKYWEGRYWDSYIFTFKEGGQYAFESLANPGDGGGAGNRVEVDAPNRSSA